jgi:hypothetical protein
MIQGVMRHGKGLKGIKEQKMEEIHAKAAKTGLSGFGYRSIQLSKYR